MAPPAPKNPPKKREAQHWYTKDFFIESEVAAVSRGCGIGGAQGCPPATGGHGAASPLQMEAKLSTAQPAAPSLGQGPAAPVLLLLGRNHCNGIRIKS